MFNAIDWDLISSYAGLLSLATLSIYVGSYASIPTAPSRKPGVEAGAPDDDDDDESDVTDRLSAEDAYLFPIFGSIALFGLYLVVKFLGKEWINWFLGWYFAIAGVGSVWKSTISLFRWSVGSEKWRSYDKIRVSISKNRKELEYISFRTPSLLLLPIGALPSVLYVFLPSARKSALLTDILALSFSHNALSLLKIDSFRTGTILLAGLFLYDVWWVFGTEVMVKVATNLDVPIKILWPKSILLNSAERGYTMLGLGDIVIPGTFVALALRFDAGCGRLREGSAPYFRAALLSYVAGLTTTMVVMHVFKAAQPALLYLSPACVLSFVLTATARGELADAWAFSDNPEQTRARPANASVEEKATSLEDELTTDLDVVADTVEVDTTEVDKN